MAISDTWNPNDRFFLMWLDIHCSRVKIPRFIRLFWVTDRDDKNVHGIKQVELVELVYLIPIDLAKLYTYTCTCTYAYTNTFTYKYMCMYMYVCICIYCVCIYIYIWNPRFLSNLLTAPNFNNSIPSVPLWLRSSSKPLRDKSPRSNALNAAELTSRASPFNSLFFAMPFFGGIAWHNFFLRPSVENTGT